MRVCKVQLTGHSGPVVFELTQTKHIDGVLGEVRSLLEESFNSEEPQILLTVEEMSQAEFNRLTEFQGY